MLGPRELMEGEFYRAGKLAVAGEVHRDRLITETEHGRAAAQRSQLRPSRRPRPYTCLYGLRIIRLKMARNREVSFGKLRASPFPFLMYMWRGILAAT